MSRSRLVREEGHAQRELMRRGQQRRVHAAGLADDGPRPVHRHRPQAKALADGDVAVRLVTIGLHGQGARPGQAQRAADHSQAVREARAFDILPRLKAWDSS